jgi:serine protease Do
MNETETISPAMKTPSKNRRVLLSAGLLALAAGGLTWSGAAIAESASPKVSVKVDEQPIARDNATQLNSFAPVAKKVAPSVVKVLVTERAKNAPEADLPPYFADPFWRRFFGDVVAEADARCCASRRKKALAQV